MPPNRASRWIIAPRRPRALAAEGRSFDVVLNMEVVEHVADVNAYLVRLRQAGQARRHHHRRHHQQDPEVAGAGQDRGRICPGLDARGTHDWNRFIPPAQLQKSLQEAGLTILKTQGVFFNILTWDWRLSSDVDVNYMIVAGRD